MLNMVHGSHTPMGGQLAGIPPGYASRPSLLTTQGSSPPNMHIWKCGLVWIQLAANQHMRKKGNLLGHQRKVITPEGVVAMRHVIVEVWRVHCRERPSGAEFPGACGILAHSQVRGIYAVVWDLCEWVT